MLRLLLASLVGLVGLLALSTDAGAAPRTEIRMEQAREGLLIVPPTVAPAADEAEVRKREETRQEPPTPEFWMQFRSYAYKQLPKHHDESFDAVWVAMPIDTSDGTVATVGVKGVWW